jgi:hypothetical protein
MGYVMAWARKEEFHDFGKVRSLVRSAIRVATCDSAIYAISELNGDRSADHSNRKYGVADVVRMVLHFCFTIFFYHMFFFFSFEYLQSHLVIADRCSI